jgi:hypothetical protein
MSRDNLISNYERVTKGRGHQKAIVTVAKEMLAIASHMLRRRQLYRGMKPELIERKYRRLESLNKQA